MCSDLGPDAMSPMSAIVDDENRFENLDSARQRMTRWVTRALHLIPSSPLTQS